MLDRVELLEKVKRRHGIVDDAQDLLIHDILDDTIAHYLAIANRLSVNTIDSIPESHSFIISDVASMRYVRRGSEGMEVERVDGYQAQYQSPEKDFDSYLGIMEKEYQTEDGSSGRLTFY